MFEIIEQAVWPHSGHYRPTEENFQELISFLKENSVDLTNVEVSYSSSSSSSSIFFMSLGKNLSSRYQIRCRILRGTTKKQQQSENGVVLNAILPN